MEAQRPWQQPTRHGKHRDPEQHAQNVLAYYHAHKHEPEFRARRKATRRRFYDRWYRKDEGRVAA